MNTIHSISASFSAAVLALSMAACGSSEPAPVQPTPIAAQPATGETTPAAEPAQHEEAEHDFPPAVTAFHDVMAPEWHAEPGEQRQADTCAAIPDFKAAADRIGSEGVPEKAQEREDRWHMAVADLNIAILGLDSACKADGREGFADAFHEVHEKFHRLIALIGHEEGSHEEHEGHEGHEGHEDGAQ